LEARDRRHLIEWTSNLRLLNSEEFEWLVGEVFRREGWRVKETGRQDRSDGNIDLRITKGNQRMIVQCKRWTAWQVGVDEIRKFSGTLLREGLNGNAGTFVTLSGFNEQAVAEAKKVGITLVDRRDLHARIEDARQPEPCPVCHSPMILDRSGRGWWFRCVTDGCSGKRDLGGDAGRAVELLTQQP
jgi:restriction system protein